MDRITPRELVRPSVVDERSAFDLQALAFLVAAVTAIAGVANLLSFHLTSRRDRGPAAPARSQVPSGNRGANGAGEGPLRETRTYEQYTVDELYAEARYRGIPGRSQMNKAELIRALRGN